MAPLFIQEAQTHKSSLPSSIKTISFSSPRSKFYECPAGLPLSKDYRFYFNFQELKNPMHETSKMSQLILESIGCEKVMGKNQMGYPKLDLDADNGEAYNCFVNINHEPFDMKQRIKEQRLIKISDDNEFALVNVNKNKFIEKEEKSNCNMRANSSTVKVVSGDYTAMGTPRAKMSFHIASIPKPQDVYRIQVNNVNQPFQHVWLERSADGSRLIHPLEKLSVCDFIDKNVSTNKPLKPPPSKITPFKLVQDVKELKDLVAKLQDTNEIAVDLEHNQYRSFQGLTCLMQISTRTEDFIVDTLKLHVHIGPYLRGIFKDPTKRKVMHGADKDILWLQRDFGVYVCNMFDTGQASRVLNMERNSLDYLLRYFCGVTADKEYQTADWRFRPLTDEMLRYAREDTHYLLHIYDLMKIKLLSSSNDPKCPESLLLEVYQRSYNICMKLYQKEITNEYSYLNIYGLHAVDLNGQQLAIVAGLCEWRDIIARAEDESRGYILPNRCIIDIANEMPATTEELCRILKFRNPHIEHNLVSIVNIVQNSIRNAYAFEAVSKRLKQERLQTEASVNSVGSSNVVTNQFIPNKKVIEGPKTEEKKWPVNISFGSFTRKQELQHLDMNEHVKVQKPPNYKKHNATCFKPAGSVILHELGSGVAEGERI